MTTIVIAEDHHVVREGLRAFLAQVAERLDMSPRTAEAHRASVLRKLRLKTQTHLVRYALRRGIIALDP